jgi:hypothetical protein
VRLLAQTQLSQFLHGPRAEPGQLRPLTHAGHEHQAFPQAAHAPLVISGQNQRATGLQEHDRRARVTAARPGLRQAVEQCGRFSVAAALHHAVRRMELLQKQALGRAA